MEIRAERSDDIDEIRHINVEAFNTEAEANLVEALRDSGIPLISLVAEENGKLIGHILFSPVTLDNEGSSIFFAGLAPMAVVPEWQNKGIGSKLVEEGLRQCERSGYAAVVVLGHHEYYPRFGFEPSVNYGIKSEYDVPAEVFLIKEIQEGALKGCRGTMRYHHAFKDV